MRDFAGDDDEEQDLRSGAREEGGSAGEGKKIGSGRILL